MERERDESRICKDIYVYLARELHLIIIISLANLRAALILFSLTSPIVCVYISIIFLHSPLHSGASSCSFVWFCSLVFVVFCFLFPFFFLAGPPSSHCYKFTLRERKSREREETLAPPRRGELSIISSADEPSNYLR